MPANDRSYTVFKVKCVKRVIETIRGKHHPIIWTQGEVCDGTDLAGQTCLSRGYDGGISIEPHMAVVFHDENVQSDAEIRFNNYVEYGKRMSKMIGEIQQELKQPV